MGQNYPAYNKNNPLRRTAAARTPHRHARNQNRLFHGVPSSPASAPETSLLFLQNLSPRNRLRLLDSRIPRSCPGVLLWLMLIESALAMREMIRGELLLADLPPVILGMSLTASGADAWRVPSRSRGQVSGVTKGSSGAILLEGGAGGVVSPSVWAGEDGCVEGERCIVVAVAELVVCDLDDGTEYREEASGAGTCGTLDLFRVCLPGEPLGFVAPSGGTGESRPELPWFVTRIAVKVSSLLPRRDPG